MYKVSVEKLCTLRPGAKLATANPPMEKSPHFCGDFPKERESAPYVPYCPLGCLELTRQIVVKILKGGVGFDFLGGVVAQHIADYVLIIKVYVIEGEVVTYLVHKSPKPYVNILTELAVVALTQVAQEAGVEVSVAFQRKVDDVFIVVILGDLVILDVDVGVIHIHDTTNKGFNVRHCISVLSVYMIPYLRSFVKYFF